MPFSYTLFHSSYIQFFKQAIIFYIHSNTLLVARLNVCMNVMWRSRFNHAFYIFFLVVTSYIYVDCWVMDEEKNKTKGRSIPTTREKQK